MSTPSPLLQNIFINQAGTEDITDYVQDLTSKDKSFGVEETKEAASLARIETLNDSIISSAVVTMAFLPLFDFNLDVELGDFILVILGVHVFLNIVSMYLFIHANRLNRVFGIAFSNTLVKGFYWTSQGIFFYTLNVLKPRLVGMNLNPIYVVFFLWLYLGFWEIIKSILSNNVNDLPKTKTK